MIRFSSIRLWLIFNLPAALSYTVFPVNGPRQCTNTLTNTECLTHSTSNGIPSTLYWTDATLPPGCSKRTSTLAGKRWQWNSLTTSTVTCDASGIVQCECKGTAYVEMYSHATCADAGFLPIEDAAECSTASVELGRTYKASFLTTTSNAPYFPLEPCWIYHPPDSVNQVNDGKPYFTTPINDAAANVASTCDSTTDRAYACICRVPESP